MNNNRKTSLNFYKPIIQKNKYTLSLVKDYYDRTKSQFKDIEDEAKKHAESFYNSMLENTTDPNIDPSIIAENANEEGIYFYETLSLMKNNHLLMAISMLYHVWEQQLIDFTKSELRPYFDFNKIKMDYSIVQEIFKLHGIDICLTNSWKTIRELKALVNVIKHGDGDSAERLRKINPKYFENCFIPGTDTLLLYGSVLLNEYAINVYENDLYFYMDAVKSFWDEMPDKGYSNVEDICKIK
jgi:hypothetical protein